MSLLKKKSPDDSDSNTAVDNAKVEVEDEFVPATTWEGLEWIGTPDWQEKRDLVGGHNFRRYVLLGMCCLLVL